MHPVVCIIYFLIGLPDTLISNQAKQVPDSIQNCVVLCAILYLSLSFLRKELKKKSTLSLTAAHFRRRIYIYSCINALCCWADLMYAIF